MGEKHFCRDCKNYGCWIMRTFPVMQPNSCPDFSFRTEVEKP